MGQIYSDLLAPGNALKEAHRPFLRPARDRNQGPCHKIRMRYPIPTSRDEAVELDRQDPLRDRRSQFVLEEGLIYLDGHSLGPAGQLALQSLDKTAQTAWSRGLIRSWNEAGWIDWPMALGDKIARLIGVCPGEVIVTDTVSVNLFKLAAAALPLAKSRVLIVERDEFPTDQYILEGLRRLSGVEMIRTEAGKGAARLAETGGVLIKSAVNYKTAAIADIHSLEKTAHGSDGLIIWDLSHATGLLALDLTGSGARLAVGCTYKYLNGGPGAPAFVYAANAICDDLVSPLSGWMGHANPFAFDSQYVPQKGVARFACGTPPILSMAGLKGTLEAFDGVDLNQLAEKAQVLGDLCLSFGEEFGLNTVSPRIGAPRGGHVSLVHEEGYAIVQALIARNIIADFRAPDLMRFGVSPLYVRFQDVWDAMTSLGDILRTEAWNTPVFRTRAKVT